MASWVTHLMIADRVSEQISELDRHSFCVGNIAPDCNVENEDWTQKTGNQNRQRIFLSHGVLFSPDYRR